MRVFIAPDYTEGNPYQKLLAKALRQLGAEVVFPAGYKRVLPLFRALRASGGAFDVLHLHWLSPYLKRGHHRLRALYGAKLLIDLLFCRLLAGCRIVWTVHNLESHESGGGLTEILVRRALSRLATAVVVHSETARQRVGLRYGLRREEIKVVGHGSYRNWYGAPPDKGEARTKLGLHGTARIFLLFGYLRPYKGVEELLSAWQSMDHRTEARLVIVGEPLDPEYSGQIRNLAAAIAGVDLQMRRVPDDEVAAWLAAADIFVLPMRDNLTSGSLVLACSYGLPVIAPRYPLVVELLGHNPLLYDPNEFGSLQRSLETALDFTAPMKASLPPDWSEVAQHTLQVYCH